jgi:O-acetyl-ADP-ribose deacetylase (regulator of RNase III)
MMASLVIGGAVAVLVVAALLVRRSRADDRVRPARPLDSTRIQLYRVSDDRFVGIVTGDLRRVRCAEVWVNSENTSMQMARFDEFSISAIIRYQGARRDRAGQVVDDRIANELAAQLAGRRSVSAGTAIVTGAGELRSNGVRHVVHVAAVQGEPGAGFRQIREVGRCVTNALTEIDKLADQPPSRTVLFPLLGTGQGSAELRSTVDALLGAVVDYFAAVPATHFTTVYFLAYTDVELAVCEAACKALGFTRVTESPSTPDPTSRADSGSTDPEVIGPVPTTTKRLQMGFVVDVMGFGQRSAPDQEAVQHRLPTVARRVLSDAGVDFDSVSHQWTGDGLSVILPTDVDPTRVLADLVLSTRRHLIEDNRLYHDRIRLRMAVGVGLVGVAATGFAGSMIIDINRLVDSEPLRAAARDHPESDLVLLVSDHVHAYVVRPGYLQPPIGEFRRVDVTVKEFHEPAWLWTAPPETTDD